MGLLRSTALGILGFLLVLTLLGFNIVAGVDRTVLDEEFVLSALEEEEVYTTVVEQMNQSAGAPEGPASVISPSLIQNQTEETIPVVYDFLHGEQDHLVIPVATDALQERMTEVVTSQIGPEQLAEFDPRMARMYESQQQYQTERSEFRQQQYQRIQTESDDELSQDELEQVFEAQRPEIRSQIITEQTGEQELGTMGNELRLIKAAGLLNESLTYERFTDRLDQLLGEEAPGPDQAGMDLPDQINVSADADPQQLQNLEQAQTAVQGIGTSSLVIPVIAIALIGVIYLVAATTWGALLVSGGAITVTGFISTAGLIAARRFGVPAIEQMAAGSGPAMIAGAGVGVLWQVTGAVLVQSILVLLVGAALIGAGVHLRRQE